MDVVLLRWPAEQARRAELAGAGRPRLLLLEDGAAPPEADDELEDWIRVPAAEGDLRARVEGLRRRADAKVAPSPDLDEDGVLRLGSEWVSLPPVEARLMGALLERYGAVVSRDALARAGWGRWPWPSARCGPAATSWSAARRTSRWRAPGKPDRTSSGRRVQREPVGEVRPEGTIFPTGSGGGDRVSSAGGHRRVTRPSDI